LTHGDTVYGVTFLDNGKTVVSAGDSRYEGDEIKFWDVATETLRSRLKGHAGRVLSVAVSSDGRFLATAGDLGALRLWDWRSEKQLHELKGHTGHVNDVAFSPDGKLVASSEHKGTIILCDAASGEQKAAFPAAEDKNQHPSSVAWSGDSRILAVACFNPRENSGSVTLWESFTGKKLRRWDVSEGQVFAVAFAPDGATVAAAGGTQKTGHVKVWDVATGAERFSLDGHTRFVSALCFSPDGQTLASAGHDRSVKLWDARTGKLRRTLDGHKGVVRAVAFAPDGKTLASGSWDGTVRLWELGR
jgi:WD40 repeat protein